MFRAEEGDLIFSNIMAWEQGIALVKPEDHGCVGNHRMLTCVADSEKAVPGFLAYYFMTDDGFAKVYAASPGTAARNVLGRQRDSAGEAIVQVSARSQGASWDCTDAGVGLITRVAEDERRAVAISVGWPVIPQMPR